MTLSLRTREIKTSSAERMIILVRRADGSPHYWSNLFALTQFRNASAAANTIRRVLQSLAVLYTWADSKGIDLDHLLAVEGFLSPQDAEDLAIALRYKAEYLSDVGLPAKGLSKKNIASGERIRSLGNSKQKKVISAHDAATRTRYITKYFRWHGSRRVSNLVRSQSSEAQLLDGQVERTCSVLENLSPRSRDSSDLELRQGLTIEERQLLLKIVQPGQESNPFKNEFIQARNNLIVRTLLETGARAGELLQIKVEDLDFGRSRITIHRSPDDPNDPRLHEVNAKTRARVVPVSESLVDMLRNFIRAHWTKVPPKQRPHGFLWITEEGVPLAQQTLNFIFRKIREADHKLPKGLCPHVMRHTWNEVFSENIDRGAPAQRITMEQEARIRERLMGWAPGSTMAAVYNRRYDRKKADEIADRMAAAIVSSTQNKEEK